MFRCEDDPTQIVYGSFDGIRQWHVNAFLTTDLLEQELISSHEERHLRLQQGTVYGAALALCAVKRDDWPSRDQLRPFIDNCRTVHESYATFMSVERLDGSLDKLTGNLRYLEYWRTGRILFDLLPDCANRMVRLEYLYHLLMCPTPDSTNNEDPNPLQPALAVLRAASPDKRLSDLTTSLTSHPDIAEQICDAVSDTHAVEQNQDNVAAILTDIGIPTLSSAEQDNVLNAIQSTANSLGGDIRVTLTKRSRRTSLDDHLDYVAHELIRVNDVRLQLISVDPTPLPGNPHPLTSVVRDDPTIGPHAWAVLLSRDVLAREFAGVPASWPRICFGLLAASRSQDVPVAYFLPVPVSPAALTRDLSKMGLRTLTMTTLSSLNFSGATEFDAAEPLFVVIDEPIRPALMGLAEVGSVNWTTFSLTGDRALHILLLSHDANPLLHFVKVTTMNTLKPLLEWIRTRSDEFLYHGDDYPDIAGQLAAMVYHLIGTFEAV